MSAEAVNARLDCGTQGVPLPAGYVPPAPPPPAPPPPAPVVPGVEPERKPRPLPPPNPDRFRGVRIFDISNLSNPKQVAAVQTCRGSHTHTLVTDPNDKDNVYIYVSGTGSVRQSEELTGCVSGDDPSAVPNTSLFSIDIIKVPLAHPELAKIVSSPRLFTDANTGAVNGLWKRGNHGAVSYTHLETFNQPRKYMYLNGEGIEIFHQPAAHTDSDAIVFFRRSDVVVAGDVFDTRAFPVIDVAKGGSIQGEIAALQKLVDTAIPSVPIVSREEGTLIIPGHGRILSLIHI